MSAWAEGGVKSDLKVVITVRSAGGLRVILRAFRLESHPSEPKILRLVIQP